jgi:putative ABC transport system permease protein
VELSYLIRLFAICGTGVLGVAWIVGFFFFERLSRSAVAFRSKVVVSGRLALQSWGVILQLVVSIVFIIVTSVVLMQMRFIGHKDLGFNREGLLYLSGISPFRIGDTRMTLMDCLNAIPQIEKVSETDLVVQHNLDPFKTTADVVWPGKQPSEKTMFNFVTTDPEFAETFQVGMQDGRWFKRGDQGKIILNEEAVQVMGLDEPIGSVVRLTLNETKDYSIVGVVRNFHTLSFRNRIQPMLFVLSDNPAGSFYLRVTPGMEQEVIHQLNQRLSSIDASFLEVHLLKVSELYDRLNDSEQTGLKLLFILSVVCLLISIFGVYAVATATMKRRRREIAIRKVAGADTGHIIYLFFRHYILQMIVAGLIGIPIACVIMNSWLQGYAYRTNLPGWLFLGIFTGIVVVVLLTVWGQIKRAANSNPAEVVKCE